MRYSRFDHATERRVAWNAAKNVGTKRPLTQKQIWASRFHLDREGWLRDKALFDIAIDSKPRGCDLVKVKIGDVVAGSDIRSRATVIQQKTNRFSTVRTHRRCASNVISLAGTTEWFDKRLPLP